MTTSESSVLYVFVSCVYSFFFGVVIVVEVVVQSAWEILVQFTPDVVPRFSIRRHNLLFQWNELLSNYIHAGSSQTSGREEALSR